MNPILLVILLAAVIAAVAYMVYKSRWMSGPKISQYAKGGGKIGESPIKLKDSGATAEEGGTAAGEGSVAVGGDIHGDVVIGQKTTALDQRRQRVEQQIDTAGGSYIGGSVTVSDGDFGGRDKVKLSAELFESGTTVYAIARIRDCQWDEPLQHGVEHVLQAGVHGLVPPEFRGEPFSLPTDQEIFEFEITIFAEDMDIEPRWTQLFVFRRDAGGGLLEFRLTPRKTGTKNVRVEYYYQRHWLTQIKFEVEVVEEQEPIPA